MICRTGCFRSRASRNTVPGSSTRRLFNVVVENKRQETIAPFVRNQSALRVFSYLVSTVVQQRVCTYALRARAHDMYVCNQREHWLASVPAVSGVSCADDVSVLCVGLCSGCSGLY